MQSSELKIQYLQPSVLKPNPRNARTHSKKQIKQIADSIRAFGFTNPVLIDENCTILAGHGRVAAAKQLGIAVPCVLLSEMTEAQKRAYIIADNKLALNAGWDDDILAIELEALMAADLDFNVEITGFSTSEIDGLIAITKNGPDDNPDDDDLPDVPSGPSITQIGDLWALGEHLIFCGDATNPDAFVNVMKGEKADMVFTDPPYNVAIDGNVGGLGRIKHREFAMAAGEMSESQFTAFLRSSIEQLVEHSVDGAIHFICVDWRHIKELLAAGAGLYSELKNMCVWVKDNGGMGTFYRSRHELVFAFKVGSAAHINNFELGQHGRYRTNVWSYRGMSSGHKDRNAALALHPTVKPVAMVADAIRDVSRRRSIVLDCFSGSGTTLIAAHKTGRRARLIELDPLYVDRSIRRWQDYAKDDAILISTGQTFAEVQTALIWWPTGAANAPA
jgi:DNA modification methylase